ncbi:transposase [uncultured Brevundimonas sp.]|uniref:REP-associated tyrosine transposase n=1 Tax=uncultured Brevundimonas sp. TaxID=213418 RepID=UPI0030EBF2B6|tara:strand:+ start:12207 stop:12839 length:633 start_codon:yes stop_codon:yes gene_type:complete
MNEHKGWHQRRYLPHLDAAAVVQHVTFRLHGTLPASVIRRLKADTGGADYQAAVDEQLDSGAGPRWLAIPDCAAIVADALRQFDGERYDLLAWCVMPNHVHVLIRQREGWPLGAVVKSWKAYTARMINRRLDRSGPFWAADYFDRYTRNEAQLIGTIRYIEANPVKARLCRQPEDWPFSSAAQDRGPSGPLASTRQPADLKVRDPFHSDR